MSTTSYNGWPASTDKASIDVGPLSVAGVEFVGGVRRGDVATVLDYVASRYNTEVEPLVNPGCWGWSYRANRNADNLSCHSSGTAVDCNAPAHPNGIEASANFTAAQIDAIHAILASVPELDEVVHWGGDWHRPALTPDPMHFEIHDHDTAKLARVAARITAPKEPDVNPDLATAARRIQQALDALTRYLKARPDNRGPVYQVRQGLRDLRDTLAKAIGG